MLPEVLDVMKPFFCEKFGNPSSAHSFGKEAAAALKSAAKQVAALIGAADGDIIFTRGGWVANTLAVNSLALKSGKKRIISSKIEHSSTYEACESLKKTGFEVIYLDVDCNGLIDLAALEQALDNDTALVSLLLVNNETGNIQDFEGIAEIIKKYDVALHYDAVQAAGKMPLDVDCLEASLLSLSAHKIYGPKGVGALYARPGIEVERPRGTLDVPGIVGFGAACAAACKHLEVYAKHCEEMRDHLERRILENCPMSRINGSCEHRICNTVNISFTGVSAQNLMEKLDLAGVAVSTGAACSTGQGEASRVLEAMQVPKPDVFGSLRFSVGQYTDKDGIDYAVEQIIKILKDKNRALGGSRIINLDI